MELMISGAPQELDFVVRICRDKVRRGLLTISNPATVPVDDKYIECTDTKEVVEERKKTTGRRTKKSE